MTSAFPSQRLKIRFLPAVPGTDAKGSSIAAKFWYDQAKIQADIALQANETKVDKAGSVMTGPLTLYGDPTSDLVASTKHYADTKVAKAGDSMTGFLTLSADPTATLHAATKAYADTKVPFTGGTMTGTLVLNGSPVGPNDAATKQYVDNQVVTGGSALFQPKDPDLSSIAANTTSGTWLFRRGDGDWAPVNIGDGLSFDTVTGDLESVGGGGGGGTGDVSASDGPVPNQLAMWIGSVTIKGINIGAGLRLATVGAVQSLEAIGTVKINGTPTPGQYATWFDSSTIQGSNLDDDLVALSALTGTHTIYYRSSSTPATWSPVVIGGGLTFVGDTLAAVGSITITPPTPVAGQTAKWTGPTSVKGANVYTSSTTAPATPDVGDFFYDRTTGVLAMSVDDGNSQQWLQVGPPAGNIASNSAFVTIRTFTSNNVYVPTPGTQFIQVECIGAGGSGGAGGSSVADVYQGGGGGGGGYSRSMLTMAQIGASQSITIGVGGVGSLNNGLPGSATSFGGLCIANGGNGGGAGTVGQFPGGGSGASPGTGDIAIAGTPGGYGLYGSGGLAAIALAGDGGPGPLGGGAATATTGNGNVGTGYGSGGSGGNAYNTTQRTGGNGAPGVVIITEYNIGAGQQGPQGLAGGVTTPLTPQGRLTLQAGVPVMTTTQSAKTTLFYSPYCGNQIPIWSGTSWATTSFNELSAVTTDTTKSPAAIGASKLNDWYVWNDAGTLRLSHGPDWANDTTRAATLTRQNGILVNTAAITNGPGANLGTYVGTTRSNASSQLDWIYGTVASTTAGQSFLNIWNAYNRVEVLSSPRDSNSSTTVSTTTYIQNFPAHRVSFVSGLPEDPFDASYQSAAQSTGGYCASGIGYDVASAFSGIGGWHGGGIAGVSNATAKFWSTAVGYHFVAGIEMSGSGTATFYGNAGTPLNLQQGMIFKMRM